MHPLSMGAFRLAFFPYFGKSISWNFPRRPKPCAEVEVSERSSGRKLLGDAGRSPKQPGPRRAACPLVDAIFFRCPSRRGKCPPCDSACTQFYLRQRQRTPQPRISRKCSAELFAPRGTAGNSCSAARKAGAEPRAPRPGGPGSIVANPPRFFSRLTFCSRKTFL